MTTQTVPEIERTALTILDQNTAHDDELRAYMSRLTSDLDYDGFPTEIIERLQGAFTGTRADYPLRRDLALAKLAGSVAAYRFTGRTDERETDIRGIGDTVVVVQTSLAANIAEFVGAVFNAHAIYVYTVEEES